MRDETDWGLVEGCALCDPGLGPLLADTEHWKLVLNKRNQNLLGKCFLALRRHEVGVTALSAEGERPRGDQLPRTPPPRSRDNRVCPRNVSPSRA